MATVWEPVKPEDPLRKHMQDPSGIAREARKFQWEPVEPDDGGITGFLGEMGGVVASTPKQALGGIASAIEAGRPEDEDNILDEWRRSAEDEVKRGIEKPDAEDTVLFGALKRGDVRQWKPSMGFSATAGGAAYLGMLAGRAVGTAVGLPFGPAGAFVGGMAGGGMAAYLMEKTNFVSDAVDEAKQEHKEKTGKDMPRDKVLAKQEAVQGAANESALWEAIPEAAGAVAGIGIAKLPAKEAAKWVQRILRNKKLADAVGKNTLARLGAKYAGIVTAETAQETVTQTGQHNIAVREGLAEGDPRSFARPGDVWESMKEVFPQTAALSAILGPVGGGIGIVEQKLSDKKRAELIKASVAEGGHEALPEGQLAGLVRMATDVSGRRKQDSELARARGIIVGEAERRIQSANLEQTLMGDQGISPQAPEIGPEAPPLSPLAGPQGPQATIGDLSGGIPGPRTRRTPEEAPGTIPGVRGEAAQGPQPLSGIGAAIAQEGYDSRVVSTEVSSGILRNIAAQREAQEKKAAKERKRVEKTKRYEAGLKRARYGVSGGQVIGATTFKPETAEETKARKKKRSVEPTVPKKAKPIPKAGEPVMGFDQARAVVERIKRGESSLKISAEMGYKPEGVFDFTRDIVNTIRGDIGGEEVLTKMPADLRPGTKKPKLTKESASQVLDYIDEKKPARKIKQTGEEKLPLPPERPVGDLDIVKPNGELYATPGAAKIHGASQVVKKGLEPGSYEVAKVTKGGKKGFSFAPKSGVQVPAKKSVQAGDEVKANGNTWVIAESDKLNVLTLVDKEGKHAHKVPRSKVEPTGEKYAVTYSKASGLYEVVPEQRGAKEGKKEVPSEEGRAGVREGGRKEEKSIEAPLAKEDELTKEKVVPGWEPTHELPDGTPVMYVDGNVYRDSEGAEIEDNYATPIPEAQKEIAEELLDAKKLPEKRKPSRTPKPTATPAPGAQKEEGKAALGQKSRGALLAEKVAENISRNNKMSWRDLFALADDVFGGTQADGAYSPRDAYDSMELGLNYDVKRDTGIDPTGNATAADSSLNALEEKMSLLPTQTRRTQEQDALQQYSTPHTHAFMASWVANLNANDVVLEPSAGTGNLAVYANKETPHVHVNELSTRRADLLENLFDNVTRENASHLHAILGDTVKPTVVVMNPPFSADVNKLGKMDLNVGASHVEQALRLLEPNGRLVAILGRGMTMNAPRAQAFWNKMLRSYNVRANIQVSGKEYRKFGTSFDNQFVVIDKTGPTADTSTIIQGRVEKVSELIPLLGSIRNDRIPKGKRSPAESGIQGATGQVEGAGGQKTPVHTPARPGGVGQAGVGPVAGSEPRGKGHGGTPARPSGTGRSDELPIDQQRPGKGGIPEPVGASEKTSQFPGPNTPRRDPGQDESGVEVENADVVPVEIGESSFSNYSPSVTISGSKPHPSKLAESAAMSALKPPPTSYKTHIDQKIINSGRLSGAQLETLVRAGDAHSLILPSGERRGFFIGDGTGVGKGAQIAGIIEDNIAQGRLKAVWVSENQRLHKDALRDVEWVGGDVGSLFKQSDIKGDIKNKKGTIFTTYDTLRSSSKEIKDSSGNVINKAQLRLDQLIDWLGKDFDGVIAFDESHNMANALDDKGSRGIAKASKRAKAGLELQRRLPNARVVYASATGATEVKNLAYADRLGLWGQGTPFATQRKFISQISSGGVAAMEVVAKDMKALGLYTSRSLSYDGVEYGTIVHKLTPAQRGSYDVLASAWQGILSDVDASLEESGAADNSNAKGRAKSAFWGSHQRFFNQVLTGLQVPAVIEDMQSELASDKSLILQLVNTNEATQERRLAQAADAGLSLAEVDLSPRDIVMQFVENSFPTTQYESYIDDNGNENSRPVVDSQGNPVQNPGAVAKKEALLDKIGSLAVPEGPIDQVVNHFGPDAVAEITGRKQRLIRHRDGSVELETKRADAKLKKEADEFMNGDRRILIFSDKGGTGRSYHASNTVKNKQQRVHYLLQPGWVAAKAVQGMGRSHRTNQAIVPIYKLVTTDVVAHRRFVSTIARRLDQLGALTKGQRDTTSQGLFSADMNLENEYGDAALETLVRDIHAGDVEGLGMAEFEKQTGLSLVDRDGNLKATAIPTVPRFLNRLLSMNLEDMDRAFNAFFSRLEAGIEFAKEQGYYDTGMETIKAQAIRKIAEQSVPGKTTRHVQVEIERPAVHVKFDQLPPDVEWARNKTTGKLFAFTKATTITDARTGNLVTRKRKISPATGAYVSLQDFHSKFKTASVSEEKARAEWDKELAKLSPITKTKTHLITGELLSVWDRLPKSQPRIVRMQTVDGEILLGRVIKNKDLSGVLRSLGLTMKVQQKNPSEWLTEILSEGATLTLSNGWTITRRVVSGAQRVEVSGPDLQEGDLIVQQGGFKERIAFQTRIFLPVSKPDVLGKVLQGRSVTDVHYHDTRFSRGKGLPASKESNARIRKHLGPKAKKVERRGIPVEMHEGTPRDAGFPWPDDVRGAYQDRKVHIFLSNLADSKEAEAVLAHEVSGHGIKDILTKTEYRKLLGRLKTLRKLGNKMVTNQYVDVSNRYKADEIWALREQQLSHLPAGTQVAHIREPVTGLYSAEGMPATKERPAPPSNVRQIRAYVEEVRLEETFAHLVENQGAKNHPLVRSARAAVRHWFAKQGFGNLNDAITDRLVARAFRYERGVHHLDPMKGLLVGDILTGKPLDIKAPKFLDTGDAPRFSRAPSVESPEFKKWFGDSKVVDESGEPLVVYHGTTYDDITSMDIDRSLALGFHLGSAEAAYDRVVHPIHRKVGNVEFSGQNIMPFFVRAKRPLITPDLGSWAGATQWGYHNDSMVKEQTGGIGVIDAIAKYNDQDIANKIDGLAQQALSKENYLSSAEFSKRLRSLLKENGYDSIRYTNAVEEQGSDSWIIFDPDQVKSATGNVGAYGQRLVTEAEAKRLGMTAEEANAAQAQGDIRFARRRDQVPEDQRQILDQASERVGRKPLVKRVKNWFSEIRSDPSAHAHDLKARINQGMFDRWYGIKVAEQLAAIEKGEEVTPENSGYLATRLSTGVEGPLAVLLDHAQLEWQDGILQPKDGTVGFLEVLGEVQDNIDDFGLYLVGRRAQELMRPSRDSDGNIHPGKITGFSPTEVDAMVGLGNIYPEFERAQLRYQEINNSVVDIAVQGGLVSEAVGEVWKQNAYVPFYRIIEEGGTDVLAPGTGKGLSHQYASRRYKGSMKGIGDPVENIMMNWTHLLDASLKNNALQMAVRNIEGSSLIEKAPMEFKPSLISNEDAKAKLADVLDQGSPFARDVADLMVSTETLQGFSEMFGITAPQGKDVIKVMVGGKPEYYHVYDPLLLRSVTAMKQQSWGEFMEIFRKPKRWLTTLVTADPAFMARNFVRDKVATWFLSRDGFFPGVHSASAALQTWKQNPEMVRALAAGGLFMSGGYISSHDPKALSRFVRAEASKHDVKKLPKRMWDFWQSMGTTVENANRLGLHQSAMRHGKTRKLAAFESKDVMDFTMRGDWPIIQFLTETVPFLGARIQGLQRLVRGAAENPLAFTAKGMMIALASVALWWLNKDREEYQKLEGWEKDLYYHFFTDDGEHFRMPKPFEIGFLFGTIPERLAEGYFGHDPGFGEFGERLVWNFQETLSIGPPQTLKPIIEQWANKSFFTERPIVGMRHQGVAPEAQFDPWTSETLIQVGKELGVSPLRMKAALRGYFGTIGMYVLSMSDVVTRHMMDYPAPPSTRLEDWPVLKSFYRGKGPARHTTYATEMYELAREANQLYRAVNKFRTEGFDADADRIIAESSKELASRKFLNKQTREMSQINKAIRNTHMRRDITPEQKREIVNNYLRAKEIISKAAIEAAG